jgi:hypothetical protein
VHFTTHEGDLWRRLELFDYTQRSFREAMTAELSPSSLLLKELMFAVNKVNYNQSNDINALAGIGMCLECPLLVWLMTRVLSADDVCMRLPTAAFPFIQCPCALS